MAIVLGIDTATSGCAAALLRDDVCLAEAHGRMPRGQSEALMPMIDDVAGRAGIAFSDIDAVAVTRGPGAFTGLRIGLAAGRALALAISKPCLGIGTFDVLLAQSRDAGVLENTDALVVAIDSKREELFVAPFDASGQPLHDAQALRPEAVAEKLGTHRRIAVVGDAAEQVAGALAPDFDVRLVSEIDLPDARVVARLGEAALAAPENAPATPLYLRPPDVTMPRA